MKKIIMNKLKKDVVFYYQVHHRVFQSMIQVLVNLNMKIKRELVNPPKWLACVGFPFLFRSGTAFAGWCQISGSRYLIPDMKYLVPDI